MKKAKAKENGPARATDADADVLRDIIAAIIDGLGHGGLSYVARRTGMSVSAFRRRMMTPCPFDGPTMRALLLVNECRAAASDPDAKRSGGYIIGTATVDGVRHPRWAQADDSDIEQPAKK
jgi:hypothetical protein